MIRANKFMRQVCAAVLAGTLAVMGVPAAALADDGPGGSGGGFGGDAGGSGGGADTQTFDYTGIYTGVIVADAEEVSGSDTTYAATDADQNAGLAQNGGVLTLTNVVLTKAGSDTNGDNCNFYGVNSILLSVNEGSEAIISSSTLTASGEGSNGVFATDSATAYVNEVTISTSADNSRGLDATYDGTIVAADVVITTLGSHCAGVATDRGGGSVSVYGAVISTAGEGSPILYSTGDVQASGVVGTATGSQLCGMEGTNTILINNSQLTSTITSKTASDPVANGVIIYQSTSGDADTSTGDTATFQVANSTLTSSIASGAMFYLTNTTADMVLYNTELDFDSNAANLILAAGNNSNSWGSAGSNGATVTVTAIQQELAGVIEADTISSVDVYLTDGSVWTGSTLISENDYSSSSDAGISVNVDATSSWVVTEDCTLTTLTVAAGGSVVDADGATATIVADGQTVVQGTSGVTVTVTGAYSNDYDESAEGELSTDLIDRSGFDETFGTSTVWAMGDTDGEAGATGDADASGGNVVTGGDDTDDTDDGTTDDTDDDTTDDGTTDDGSDDGTTGDDDATDDDSTGSDGIEYGYFEDVTNPDSSYYEAVYQLAAAGYVTGTTATTFSPNATLTRAQMVAVLWRICEPEAYASYVDEAGNADYSSVVNETAFTDVADGAYYTAAVAWAAQAGVTLGTSATTFDPNAKCTFEQYCTFLVRAMLGGEEAVAGIVSDEQAAEVLAGFADAADVSAFADNSVAYLVQAGLVEGYDTDGDGAGDSIVPGEDVARWRMALLTWRAVEAGLIG